MATLARSSAQRSAGTPNHMIRAVAAELRLLLDRRDGRQAQALIADFAVRHRLTHRDVDAVLVVLTQNDAHDMSAAVVTPYVDAPPLDGPLVTVPVPIEAIETPEPSGRAAEDETDEPDNDLAWMFGDGPKSPSMRVADDIVGRALNDLLGDWSRTGGQLTHAEVALLTTNRKLSPDQYSELLDLLIGAGVELPAPTDFRPMKTIHKGYEFQGDSVGHYLREISRYPLIDATREVELWSLMSQGFAAQEEFDATGEDEFAPRVRRSLQTRVEAGRHAHAELVCANLRLVVSIAKARHYESTGVEFADRVQDGNLGLMRAADKFDGSKGFKFSTYATWWIKQAIERGIGDRGRTIRIPIHFHEQVQKVRRARARLSDRLNREPTLAEIANATGLEPGHVQAAMDHMHPCRSLDYVLAEDGDLRLSDILIHDEDRDGRTDPAEIIIHATFQRDVGRMLRELLPERSACVLERRFGFGTAEEETLDKIGSDYGISRERIRQIQDKGLATLRDSRRAAALRSYLVDDSKAGWPDSLERKAS